MRLALLTGAAALSLAGAAGAQAQTVYVEEPAVVETAPVYDYYDPGYVYAAPAPVIAAPPSYAVVPRRQVIINRPVAEDGIVTTGYSASNCYIDLAGVERCF